MQPACCVTFDLTRSHDTGQIELDGWYRAPCTGMDMDNLLLQQAPTYQSKTDPLESMTITARSYGWNKHRDERMSLVR